jgi:hypothetical protein
MLQSSAVPSCMFYELLASSLLPSLSLPNAVPRQAAPFPGSSTVRGSREAHLLSHAVFLLWSVVQEREQQEKRKSVRRAGRADEKPARTTSEERRKGDEGSYDAMKNRTVESLGASSRNERLAFYPSFFFSRRRRNNEIRVERQHRHGGKADLICRRRGSSYRAEAPS